MKGRGEIKGFTLIEMLVVIAIIVVLVGMVVGIAKRIDDQGKQRLCVSTIELLGNALEQFRDFGYEYKDGYAGLGLDFPLDCSGFIEIDLEQTLQNALYPGVVIDIRPNNANDPCFSASEALCFVLNQVPECRQSLGKIDKSLVTNDINGTPITITIGASPPSPFDRIIDPWKTHLRYDYYAEAAYPLIPDMATKKTFPVITSAGPDKVFDTLDDISNRKPK